MRGQIGPLLRGFFRAPGAPLLAGAILTAGVAVNLALFTFVNRALFHPFDYQDPARLVAVEGQDERHRATDFSAEAFEFWSRRAASFRLAGISTWRLATLTGVRNPEDVPGACVSRDLFAVLGAAPELGRALAARDFASGAPPVVVISDPLWRRQFDADPTVLGRQILLDGEGYTVVGVMGPRFAFPRPLFELWMPIRPETPGALHASYEAVARLKPGVTEAQATSEMNRILKALPRQEDRRRPVAAHVENLRARYTADYRRALLLLWGAAGLILLIASANAAGLMLARSAERAPEFAVRAALGASRRRLAFLIAGDAMIPAVLAGAAGAGLGSVLLHALANRLAGQIPVADVERIGLDGWSLAAALGAVLLTGLLSALPSALILTRPEISSALTLRSRGASSSRAANFSQTVLAALEVALAVVLLTGSGLLLRSLSNILAVNTGFEAEHVLTARAAAPVSLRTAGALAGYYSRLLESLETLPGVRASGLVTTLPMGGIEATTSFRAEGDARPADSSLQHATAFESVSPGYFKAMGIRIVAGRPFTDADRRSAILSASFARRIWPGQDPIGRRVTRDEQPGSDDWLSVVGVAADVITGNPAAPPPDMLYLPYRQSMSAAAFTTLVIRASGDPLLLASGLRARVHSVNPDQPLSKVETMTAYLSRATAEPRLHAVVITFFAGAALILSVSGVFAVVSFAVLRRRREFAIRSALGARPSQSAAHAIWLGLAPVLVGAAVGLAAAFAGTRLLDAELYRTAPGDPVVLLAAAGLQVAAACAACVVPAWRAARVEPALALRAE